MLYERVSLAGRLGSVGISFGVNTTSHLAMVAVTIGVAYAVVIVVFKVEIDAVALLMSIQYNFTITVSHLATFVVVINSVTGR